MIKKAAAIKGDIEHKKAQVLSSATGSLAEEMLKIAKEHNIKIHQDANLAEVLSTLEVYENFLFSPRRSSSAIDKISIA